MESFSTKPNLEQIKIFLQSFQPGIFQKNLRILSVPVKRYIDFTQFFYMYRIKFEKE